MPYSKQEREDLTAKVGSYLHISNGYRPNTICIITMPNGGRRITGESGKALQDMHADVQALYALVPAVNRGVGHGVCAEADAMTKLFNVGVGSVALRGASSRAYSAARANQRPIPPCGSCTWVYNHLGVNFP